MTPREKVARRKQSLHAELTAMRASGLRPGEPIPPVRELAARHQLSLRCVNTELQKLVGQGKLYTIPRLGTFMADTSRAVNRGDTVAMLCPFPFDSNEDGRRSGWHQAAMSGANAAIHRREFHVLTLHAPRFLDEVVVAEDIERLAMRHLAGVIVADFPGSETRMHRLVAGLRKHAIPVVAISDHAAFKTCDRIVSDQEAGGYEIAKWLLARDAKNIVPTWFGPTDRYWLPHRLAGYGRAMNETGRTPLPLLQVSTELRTGSGSLFDWDLLHQDAQQASAKLKDYMRLNGKIDALMAASDGHVPILALALKFLGLEPNEDVLLAGYDNYWNDLPDRQRQTAPPLISVDKDNWQLGERAVELLFARLDSALPQPAQREVFTPQLVELKPDIVPINAA